MTPELPRLLPGWRDVRRLLVVRLDNIGDVVLTTPALRAIKTALPQAHLALLASPAGAQAAALLPSVDEVIPWRAAWQQLDPLPSADPSAPPADLQLIRRLRRGRYDAAVILTSFSQTAYPAAYACYLAGIPLRLGYARDFGGQVLTHPVLPPPDDLHQAERSLHLLRAAGFPAAPGAALELRLPPAAVSAARRRLRQAGVAPGAGYIAVVPGASCQARRYPARRFAQLAALLARRSGLPLLLLGSPRETDLRLAFAGLQPAPLDLIGQTTLAEFAALLAGAALVVANDSAALHLADAFERPLLALFSGTDLESQWRPRRAPAVLLRRPTICSPCYRFECPYHLDCLEIPPAEAAEAGMTLLAARLSAGLPPAPAGAFPAALAALGLPGEEG
ncbi:MAG: glycosyltransferase family 9 protein [Chloroflexota bacterium]